MGQTLELPEVCPRCGNKSEGFRLHDHRKRTFLVIVGVLVKTVVTWLLRYKCPLCKKTFTMYPDWAAPHKHYALPMVEHFSEKYINGAETYQNCCREGLHRVGYEDEDGRLLEGTTIWRWVGGIGQMKNTLHNALEMVESKLSGSGVFRAIRDVLPAKYRSEERKIILQSAWQLLNLRDKYQRLFFRPIFPRFAFAE